MRDLKRLVDLPESVPRVTCRICDVQLHTHDGSDCCPCCGTTRNTGYGEARRGNCGEHGFWCEHWQYLYLAAVAKRAQCLEGRSILTEDDLLAVLLREAAHQSP